MKSQIAHMIGLALILALAAPAAYAESEYGSGDTDRKVLETLDGGAAAKSEEAEGDWSLALGFGLAVGPEFEGSESYSVGPLPAVSFSYRDIVSINPGGIEVNILQSDNADQLLNYALDASFGYDLGRDQDDDIAALRGTGNVGFTYVFDVQGMVMVGPAAAFLGVTQHISGHTGTLIDFGARLPIPLLRNLFASAEIGAIWASTDYMRELYGISADQSRDGSLYGRADIFDARGSLYQFYISTGFMYRIYKNWGVNIAFQYARLLGDAEKSPIVKKFGDPDQFTFGVFSTYRFNW